MENLEPMLHKQAKAELYAHTMRLRHLGREVVCDISWAILIRAMNAELQSMALLVDEVATEEGVPSSLILRWAKALIDKGLIQIQREGLDKYSLVLLTKGREAMVDYLSTNYLAAEGWSAE